MMYYSANTSTLACSRGNKAALQCPMRSVRKKGLKVTASADRFGASQPFGRDQDKHQHNFPFLPKHHHSMPWQEYIHNIVNAIEAEADANTAFKDAYSSNTTADSTTSSSDLKNIASSEESHKSLSDDVKDKLQQAMQKQDDARRFIWAAEYKANELFCRLKDRSRYDASSRGVRAAENDTEDQFEEVQAALLQGVGYARLQWSLAMQLAHNMWQKSQAAAAGAASSLQSVMSPLLALHLQPVDQAVPVERTVQSLQQMRQMRNETVADVAASLARSFRQGMIQHEMHTEEAREWLENLWLMDPDDIAINDKPGSSMPHTPGMQQQSVSVWASVVGLMAVMSVWPSLANW